VAVASAGPYANLHLDPDRITMPASHNPVFYRPDALPVAQPTASKHYTSTVAWGDFERFFDILLLKNFNIANAVIVKF